VRRNLDTVPYNPSADVMPVSVPAVPVDQPAAQEAALQAAQQALAGVITINAPR